MKEIEPSEKIEIPWLQMEGEPDQWYRMFMAYYLTLGPSRNLTRAYLRCMEKERPHKKQVTEGTNLSVMVEWSEAARLWKWRNRAEAFDLHSSSENFLYVDKARDILIQGTVKAAETLIAALDVPRTAVAAAKEILDRGGLPGTHLIGVGRIEPYTADDLHRAEQDLEEWENKIRGKVIDVDASSSDTDSK